MGHSQKLLTEMDALLDLLIDNAEAILIVSKENSIQDELLTLQKQQDDWLSQLVEKDDLLREYYVDTHEPTTSTLRQKVDHKIDLFQELNAKFIERMQKL